MFSGILFFSRMPTAITRQHVAYLPKAAPQVVALGLLNALISVTFLLLFKCDMVSFFMAGRTCKGRDVFFPRSLYAVIPCWLWF